MKSDLEELMPRLLPVDRPGPGAGPGPGALELDGAPSNPQDYLRLVQLEAASCPDVVVAQIDPKKLKKHQTVNASVSGCEAAPLGLCPSLSWQQQQVANFSDVRQNVTRNRQHWNSHTLDGNVAMPELSDDEGWRRFCLGESVYQGSSSHCDTRPDPEPQLDYTKVGFPPFLSIISRLNQSTVLLILDVLIAWFEEHEFVPQLGCWLYALLASLEKPLLPEAHSSIRQLARRSALLRRSLESEEDERLPALNLLICLVARYFEQSDLADQPQ